MMVIRPARACHTSKRGHMTDRNRVHPPRPLVVKCTCIRMLQFYARVVVELELRYVQRPLLASGSEPT